MRAARLTGQHTVTVQDVPKPELQADTDVIMRVVRTCVCGSDLWFYRDELPAGINAPCGHEAIGVIESAGSAVKDFKVGDFVITPFTYSCGECPVCKAGFTGSCPHGSYFGGAEGEACQAEFVRIPLADGTLVHIPEGKYTEEQLASFLALSDVMATGYHAAFSAEVKEGDTVVVIGDGAVGLSAVLGAKLMGAGRIIAMSRHEDRQKIALEFGATDIIAERGAEGEAKVLEMTGGYGADAVLECVGTQQAIDTATKVIRAGGIIGRVGAPHTDGSEFGSIWFRNVGVRGGMASVRYYDLHKGLVEMVAKGEINPGLVFTNTYSLEEIPQAYADMHERKAIKAYVKVSEI
ncbi:MAG: alcohol dehydrogenase catalytic domain-containing protein [Corynebacterium sp.]|nr:alcohol dehydrogenase catalytic domain-containing protein [Corynebacterium sp.]